MPFRHIPPGQFDVDLLKAMQAAYDGVSKELGIDGSNPLSANLASTIIDLAAGGERTRPQERALEELKVM